MAEDLLSTSITRRNNIAAGVASTVPCPKILAGAKLKSAVAAFTVAAGDTLSKYWICQIPAHGRISRIAVKCEAAIVAMTVDFGLYRTTADGGAAVDADCYASAVDLDSGIISTTEVNQRYTTLGIETIEQMLWQDGGVSTSPASGTMYDFIMTSNTGASTGGAVTVIVEYVDGD